MLKTYKYNNKGFIKLNNFQNKNIKEFEKKIENNEYNLIKNKCPCNKPNSDELIASRDRFGIKLFSYVCKNCGLIRQNPTLDEKSLKKFYSDHYRNIYEGEVHAKHFEKIFKSQQESGKNIYSLIQKNLQKKNLNILNYKKVLEVGCGPGGILNYFKLKGHLVLGLDFDQNYKNMTEQKGIDFLSKDFLDKDFKGEFDIIILSHFIEHALDLDKLIEKIKSLLKIDGVFYILTPGVFKFHNYKLLNLPFLYQRMLFLYYIQNAHTYYFTLNTLKNVFIKHSKDFLLVYGDEEIQTIFFRTNQNFNKLEFNNDYKKIISFYKKNFLRFMFFKNFRLIAKIAFYTLYNLKKKLIDRFLKVYKNSKQDIN